MYDPVELSRKIEKLVTKRFETSVFRKYYRFRPAEFYGGIASADCVGCNLRCIYCWSNDPAREGKIGKFYSPEEVVSRLVKIAKEFGYKQLRITGNEPTLSKEHLLQVLELVPSEYVFILETNGILLGAEKNYVKELKKFPNLYIRVSFKGCTPAEFHKLTEAKPEAFQLQLNAIRFCVDEGIPCHPAILIDLVRNENLRELRLELEKINKGLPEKLEFERLILYPNVLRRLRAAGIFPGKV